MKQAENPLLIDVALQGGGSGRHLEQSIFDLANLPNVDLSGAYLEGASLVGTQFRGALLNGALGFKTQSFFGPAFRARRLFGVQLMGAFLNRAQLQGASLAVLNLSGASLSNAQLQGTFFGNSPVWGVSLESAQLQGTGLLSGLARTDLRKKVYLRRSSVLKCTFPRRFVDIGLKNKRSLRRLDDL